MVELNPNCGECGAYMQHNRLKGHLDLDYIRLVLECERCGNTRHIQIDPIEEEEKKNFWKPAIERHKLGRARPEDPEEPKLKPVGEVVNDNKEEA